MKGTTIMRRLPEGLVGDMARATIAVMIAAVYYFWLMPTVSPYMDAVWATIGKCIQSIFS